MPNGMLSHVRSNPRLRWGLWVILGILWFYAILVLHDVLQDEQDKYHDIIQSVSRLNAQLAQPEWINRAVSAKTMAVQMESRLWQAPTSGLAQAAFQDWLRTTLAQVGVNQAMLTVIALDDATSVGAGPVAGVPADLWKVRATLSFELNPENFIALMNRIEFGEKLVGVETLSVRKEPAPRVDMQLVAYFQKQANPEQPDHAQTMTDISPLPPAGFPPMPVSGQSGQAQAKSEQPNPPQPGAGPPEAAQARPNMPADPFTTYLRKKANP